MSVSNAVVVFALSTSAWVVYRVSQIGRRETDLPPGPPTVPVLGNLLSLPKSNIQYKFTEWAKEYGDVYSVKLGPATAIVVTSITAVRELMDKKSATTSDRPANHMVDLTVEGKNLIMARYDDTWKKLRRGAREVLAPQACLQHLPIQKAEATQLMYDLLTYPEDFYESIRRYSGSVILSIIFGIRTPRISSPEFVAMTETSHYVLKVIDPAAHPPVDAIPILQKVPERFASWKRLCRKTRSLQRAAFFGLLDRVERRTARGEGNGCFTETLYERAEEWGLDRELVGYLGGALNDGATDTTTFYLRSLVLALVAYPIVQRKAQKEIDAVIGSDHAPTLEDLGQLPYVQAVIRENHRFRPVGPLGIPHAASADTMYKGYRIPAGSTIFVNIWGIFHDEEEYENESIFNPDRHLNNGLSQKDVREDVVFGCGRRTCPGMHLANNSIALNVMNLLWAFNFEKARDSKTGAEIEPDLWDYDGGPGMSPNPFKCSIIPRSPRHKEVIERQYAEATAIFSAFEHELSEEDRKFVEEQRKGH